MTDDEQMVVRRLVIRLLEGGDAHPTLETVAADLPLELQGKRPRGLPYSPWMLLEHLRISTHDIVEFTVNPSYESPEWPDGYWPKDATPPSAHAWEEAVEGINEDLRRLKELVADPEEDLYSPLPHGDGQTIFREALLAADHCAWHLGQIVVLRRLLNAW